MLSDQKLRDILIKQNYLTKAEAEKGLALAKEYKTPLEQTLISEGLMTKEVLGQALAEYFKADFLSLDQVKPDRAVVALIPEAMARSKNLAAVNFTAGQLILGMSDPADKVAINLIKQKAGKKVLPFLMLRDDLEEVWSSYKKSLDQEFKDILAVLADKSASQDEKEEATIEIVDSLLRHGNDSKASDIHIEPYAKQVVVRFRIDGVMYDELKIDKKFLEPIVSRIKIMAKMRIDEHRAAQDGKLRYELDDGSLDVRVSIVPIVEGENVVLRLLASRNKRIGLTNLGFGAKDLKKLKRAMDRPHGMILVTGPTGSGKTTTLYAILTILNKTDVHIATIEDPVEYNIEGVSQIQVDPKTNLTFAAGLRAIVRQDPDIIMVGEIRDKETAGISINSALTGHLVLSSLHTNDAPTALPRLIDMEVEPFLVASTINLIIAQRLVRKNCEKCRVSYKITAEEKVVMANEPAIQAILKAKGVKNLDKLNLYKGQGCPVCGQTGYTGRVGIFEVMEMTDEIRGLVTDKASSPVIMKEARAAGMTSMLTDGLEKVFSGVTSLDEVLKATRE
jgi:type IV pilus assembly protein PilB